MDKPVLISGLFLFLAGLVGVVYGVGVNVPGMVARGATDYSGITAYITEWLLVMLAGLFLVAKSLRSR
ncbi:MAG: hypothetical protein ACLP5V_13935 [Candidatus Bathyarchaeia archaeon]